MVVVMMIMKVKVEKYKHRERGEDGEFVRQKETTEVERLREKENHRQFYSDKVSDGGVLSLCVCVFFFVA